MYMYVNVYMTDPLCVCRDKPVQRIYI